MVRRAPTSFVWSLGISRRDPPGPWWCRLLSDTCGAEFLEGSEVFAGLVSDSKPARCLRFETHQLHSNSLRATGRVRAEFDKALSDPSLNSNVLVRIVAEITSSAVFRVRRDRGC